MASTAPVVGSSDDDRTVLVGPGRGGQRLGGRLLQDRVHGERHVVGLGRRRVEEQLAEVLRALGVGLQVLVVLVLDARSAVEK